MEVWTSELCTVQVTGNTVHDISLAAEKTWKVLNDAIHEINNHNASGLSFEELYRQAIQLEAAQTATVQIFSYKY